MKISYQWLKDFVAIDTPVEELSEILTNTGLEVEGVELFEEVKGGLKGLVVGEVLSCEKHPDADKLSLTTVNVGSDGVLKIVCGAPNVAVGQKVIVATLGAELEMDGKSFVIKKTKIRGQESTGMICAEDEIGLGTSHDGIMVLDAAAVPGTPASEYFDLYQDTVFEIGLTPNRIDAASHFGTARDVAAFYNAHNKGIALKPVAVEDITPDNEDFPFDIQIEDTEGCRRFTGLTMTDVQVGPSPKWLQNRLKAIGLTPKNNVVDITNYVLHEMGQPLHAYDVDQLSDNKIVVKRMPEGTPFVTLDEEERKLSAMDVLVCDGQKPHCIAGVFGGLHSGVTEKTKRIFLESAYFDPVFVRKTAKRHGLSTDSSFRFERGVDPSNTLNALKRAASLIKEIAGGKVSSQVMDVHPKPIAPWQIEVSYTHIDRLIGKELGAETIQKILSSLDIKVLHDKEGVLTVEVPTYRVDVTREADIVEEILRIYGYNNIDFGAKLNSSISYRNNPDNEALVNKASDYLSANGFTEIMANSLTKGDYYTALSTFPQEELVPMLNPLSADLNVMRQTLLFGGLEAIARNINHRNPNLRMYEYGRVYALKENNVAEYNNFSEAPMFAMFLTGNKEEQSWAQEDTSVSYFHLKAYFTQLLDHMGIAMQQFRTSDLEACSDIFAGGAAYQMGKKTVIRAGSISGKLLQQFGIEQEVFFAEISWADLLPRMNSKKKFKELPKYPEVRRDLALLLNEDVPYSKIEELARRNVKNILTRVDLFDYYKGKNIPEGKKSYAVSFFLQDTEKTLTDKVIDKTMSKLTQTLLKELDAELR